MGPGHETETELNISTSRFHICTLAVFCFVENFLHTSGTASIRKMAAVALPILDVPGLNFALFRSTLDHSVLCIKLKERDSNL